MTPEEKARQEIDRQLERCGWIVQDHSQMNISAGPVAIREFPLTTGSADYMLYVDGKAIGVIEAKPEGHTLTGVETQSAKYLQGYGILAISCKRFLGTTISSLTNSR